MSNHSICHVLQDTKSPKTERFVVTTEIRGEHDTKWQSRQILSASKAALPEANVRIKRISKVSYLGKRAVWLESFSIHTVFLRGAVTLPRAKDVSIPAHAILQFTKQKNLKSL